MVPPQNIIPTLLSFSSSLPNNQPNMKKRSRHFTIDATDNEKPLNQSPPQQPMLSASIPLPKSHIHRTPSELQLCEDKRRADYEDVRMFSRLVVGIQSQCVRSGYVHPLTKKSLQDIVHTKQAKDEELECTTSKLHPHYEEGEDGGGDWEVAYNGGAPDDAQDQASVDTPRACHPLGMNDKTPSVIKTSSNGSIVSNLADCRLGDNEEEEDEEEDGCCFQLEL